MKSEKEILDALKVIQEVCKEAGRCEECCLRNGVDDCGIFLRTDGDSYDTPQDWDLKSNENPRLILN